MDEARSEVAAGLALDRHFTIANFQSAVWSDNPLYLAQHANYQRHAPRRNPGGMSAAGKASPDRGAARRA
jgi:hypothetical protein